MALPDLTLVPVRWSGVMLDGSPAKGKIVLRPKADRFLVDVQSVFAALLVGELDEDGNVTLLVPATDDESLSVEGFTYEVFEDLSGDLGARYEIEVPLSFAETGIDLNEVVTVTPSPGTPIALVTRAEFETVKSAANAAVTDAELSAVADTVDDLDGAIATVASDVEDLNDAVSAVDSTVEVVSTDLDTVEALVASGRLSESALATSIGLAVEDEVEVRTPGTELLYVARTTTFTTTSTAQGTAITGLSGTVVGKGKPVEIKLRLPCVFHSVANTGVIAYFSISPDSSPTATAGERESSPATNIGPSIEASSRPVLADGVTYTITAYLFGQAAGTTTAFMPTYGHAYLRVVSQ